ncbi:MAG: helix-turn-helix domain-containing protein [Pseudomonadota bacterium]|uniref:MarR family transcriptional regulator n=1 Tax=Phenylobacterium sp. TaxID=1871053 RepID=UPI002722DBD6|nr:helix-turn-helix domain-containing protein [Phenylobacterium sp.]MDO9430780.1 helix-turn-helix domain-containing protein [Phenylobacterium sp.]
MALLAEMDALCLGHRSRRAARAVSRAFNQRLRPLNLNISQFILLGVIARGVDRSVAAMAEEIDLEPSALLRNLKLLEERGLIAITGGRGRRGRRIAITQPGLDLITSGVPIWVKAQSDLAQALGGSADATRAALADLEQAALGLEKAER